MDVLAALRACWSYELMATDWGALEAGRAIYVGFNLCEAAAWFGFAGWALVSGLRRGAGRWAALWALAFVLFGCSDLLEADALTVGLLLFKVAVLGLILACRKVVTGCARA